MSYEFVDVINEGASPGLPAEALSVNTGNLTNPVYLEELVPGYRTLYTHGRELLAPELSLEQIGMNDGAELIYKRYPERLITVGYQLMAESNATFRSAYNLLNAILNVENAVLIFRDEADKYFRGTLSDITDPDPGRNVVKGEMTFTCTDPFKYSIEEQVVTADANGVISVDYAGTFPSRPILEADIITELGFVGFVNEDGRIIQIGDPDEADEEEYDKSEILIDKDFAADMNASGWASNNAITQNNYPQQGTVKFSSSLGVTGDNYGSNTTTWHGPSLRKNVPADSHGVAGAANWTVSWEHLFYATNLKTMGEFMVGVSGDRDGSEVTLAEIHIHKSASGNNNGAANFNALGKKLGGVSFTADKENKYTGTNGGSGSIELFGSTLRFTFGGKIYSYNVSDLAGTTATKIWIMFGKNKTNTVINVNSCTSIRFVTHDVTDWRDVPNKLLPYDTVVADCSTGRITHNDVEAYGLGALGNDWETFVLRPGENEIQCVYSDWGETSPEFSVRYREVFL